MLSIHRMDSEARPRKNPSVPASVLKDMDKSDAKELAQRLASVTGKTYVVKKDGEVIHTTSLFPVEEKKKGA